MKRLIQSVLFLIGISILYTSCGKKHNNRISESEIKEVVSSEFAKNYPDFDPIAFLDHFRNTIQSDSILEVFYARNGYHTIWINDTLNTSRVNALITIIDDIEDHGLPADFFDKLLVASIADSINSGYFKDSTLLYDRLSRLEKTATNISMKYIKGMQFGFINPRKIFIPNYAIHIAQPDSSFYEDMYTDMRRDPIEALLASQPKDDTYRNMQEKYRELRQNKGNEIMPIKDPGTKSYKLGDRDKNISAIANRLIATNEYIPTNRHDSLSSDSLHMTLNKDLLEAVNMFRKRNSIVDESKEIGSSTIEILNRPLSYFESKIKANLERYRWRRTKSKNAKNIEVNIASGLLVATSDKPDVLVMKICMGKATSKTPVLESNISYINLNPTWGVPMSIARNEIVMRIKRDKNHSYFKRNNMKLYKGGKEVDPSTIDWAKIDPSKFAYQIRQESGDGNSLGRLKFMFNNSFSVYLHDTPQQAAFSRRIRTVSHGCVRVHKPLDLAYFCLNVEEDELYKDRLRYSIGYQPVSKEGKEALKAEKLKKISDIISPKEKVSLFIDYQTVYTMPDDNELHYADDVYGYDEIILQKLGS